MGISRGPKVAGKGLIACFDASNPLSYPGSGNTWHDISGHGNDATFSSAPTWHEGSGYFTFDESYTCTFSIPSGLNWFPDSEFTYEICLRELPSGDINRQKIVFGNKGYNTANDGFCLTHASSPNSLYAQINNFTTGEARVIAITQAGLSVPDSLHSLGFDWMIHFTRLNNKFTEKTMRTTNFHTTTRTYNGSPHPTGNFSSEALSYNNLYQGDGTLYGIGNSHTSTSSWNGDIAYIRVYDRRLSDAEIHQNKEAFFRKFSP